VVAKVSIDAINTDNTTAQGYFIGTIMTDNLPFNPSVYSRNPKQPYNGVVRLPTKIAGWAESPVVKY
jgi:hypothetical protein